MERRMTVRKTDGPQSCRGQNGEAAVAGLSTDFPLCSPQNGVDQRAQNVRGPPTVFPRYDEYASGVWNPSGGNSADFIEVRFCHALFYSLTHSVSSDSPLSAADSSALFSRLLHSPSGTTLYFFY